MINQKVYKTVTSSQGSSRNKQQYKQKHIILPGKQLHQILNLFKYDLYQLDAMYCEMTKQRLMSD